MYQQVTRKTQKTLLIYIMHAAHGSIAKHHHLAELK